MSRKENPTQEGPNHKCEGCKRSLEHLSSILPFTVLENMTDKPLKIRGIAMTTGMSRNQNIYTAEELQAFAEKLAGSPIYIEHVSVPNAIGKVLNSTWDGHDLWYEAEIYDDQTSQKIRNGLIQHVSVGADYEAIDLVDGKVPHGLHNAELSLVAVPGIPQTNIQVIEKLQEQKQLKDKLTQKEDELSEAKKTIENLQKLIPKDGLLKEPQKIMMPLSEHIALLESLLPSKMVEHSSLGLQRLCQSIRAIIFNSRARLAGGN